MVVVGGRVVVVVGGRAAVVVERPELCTPTAERFTYFYLQDIAE